MNEGTKKAFPLSLGGQGKTTKKHCNNGVLCTLILTQIEWREQVMKKNQFLSNEVLLDNACELTSTANQLDIIVRLINDFEYSRVKGDMYPIHHQVNNGLFGSLGDSLTDIKKTIQKVSDTICPNEWEENL